MSLDRMNRGELIAYCVDANAEITRLREANKELADALQQFVDTCDHGNPMELMQQFGLCCANARPALSKHKGEQK